VEARADADGSPLMDSQMPASFSRTALLWIKVVPIVQVLESTAREKLVHILQ